MCKEKFEQAGWISFLKKFKGHHEGVSHGFTQSYDDEYVQLGGLQLQITKYTIAEGTILPDTMDKYFKCVNIKKELCQKFLEPEHLNRDWSKGIPMN